LSKYNVGFVDLCGGRCKNLQFLNTIEIFYFVNTECYFNIEYKFHRVDFVLWESLYLAHTDMTNDCFLYDIEGKVIDFDKFENLSEYYILYLSSKDANLYRNINIIPYLWRDDGWSNENQQMILNTWEE